MQCSKQTGSARGRQLPSQYFLQVNLVKLRHKLRRSALQRDCEAELAEVMAEDGGFVATVFTQSDSLPIDKSSART